MDANDKLVVKYYNDGLTYKSIAEKIPELTRNMIINRIVKLKRIGAINSKRKEGCNELSKMRNRKLTTSNFAPINGSRKREMGFVDIEKDRKYTTLPNGVDFMSLKRNQCHFPYNGLWCGHEVKSGCSYCEIHQKECYKGKGAKL